MLYTCEEFAIATAVLVAEPTMLRIEMTDWEGRTYHAVYDSFRIDNEKGLYRLHIGNYNGDAGDSLRSHWENHDGMPFR